MCIILALCGILIGYCLREIYVCTHVHGNDEISLFLYQVIYKNDAKLVVSTPYVMVVRGLFIYLYYLDLYYGHMSIMVDWI